MEVLRLAAATCVEFQHSMVYYKKVDVMGGDMVYVCNIY